MKSIIFCILFLSVLGISAQNRTYYYERIAKVKNGNKSMDSGDGHYLTINNKILYESDENGFSKKKGTVTYMNSNNNRPMYEGTSYLGSNLSYVFNSDYSRLNIHAVDGTIYVYQRKSSPTEGMMRVYESDDSPYNSYSFSNTQQNNSSSNNKTISQKKNRKEKEKELCHVCKGTKYVSQNIPTVCEYGIRKPVYYICRICGKSVARNSGHGHKTCPYCKGYGYIR